MEALVVEEARECGTDACIELFSGLWKVWDAAGLSPDEEQRVLEASRAEGGLQEIFAGYIASARLAGAYCAEIVNSEYDYTLRPRPLREQVRELQDIFPGLGGADEAWLARAEQIGVGDIADGWFAFPNWPQAAFVFGDSYSQALVVVLEALRSVEKSFDAYHWGQIDESHLRQTTRAKEFWDELSVSQSRADILVVPIQAGRRHRGLSQRRARETFWPNEFGLGAFAAASLLLTHPERLRSSFQLWLDCAGDEFSCDGNGFSQAPFFQREAGELRFDVRPASCPHECCGSASGFIL